MFSKIGLSGLTGSSSSEKIEEEKEKTEDKEKEETDFFSNAFSKVRNFININILEKIIFFIENTFNLILFH